MTRPVNPPSSGSARSPQVDPILHCRGRVLDCSWPHPQGAVVMGILNVTPDSFSDGGRYLDVAAALRHAEEMLRNGATIIDVGGESSRPRGAAYGQGATAVPADEEIARVAPVIERIVRDLPDAIVSIDTYKPEVARAALERGAHVVNDVTGLRYHPETALLAAEFDAAMVLMHSVGRPGDMPQVKGYRNVVREVSAELSTASETAEAAGVRSIVLDPGFGFGKTVDENFAVLGGLDRLRALGYPVLVGVSRKNSIGVAASGGSEPLPVDERLFGTLGATAVAVLRGASIVRTHDVRPTVEMLRTLARAARSSDPRDA